MTFTNFTDYYKILQVHYDASPEVIHAAYKRLSRIYHPDNGNSFNENRMSLINLAYETLKDSLGRNIYHKQWLEHFTDRSSYVHPRTSSPSDTSSSSAQIVMEDFFFALKSKNWENAYYQLTQEDKAKILPDEFYDWKSAVDSCYEMQGYKIKYYKTYNNCYINDISYRLVMEFSVSITDLNRQTYELSTETLHKYAAFDGFLWKVCLGMNSLKQSILRFKLLANRKENFNPLDLYHNAVNHYDSLTGLLSEMGFYEEAGKEVARNKRYHNPFSLMALRVKCENSEQESLCLYNSAMIIKKYLRVNDIAGHLNNNFLICLLIETKKAGAEAAARKFVKLVNEFQNQSYQITAGVSEFKEHSPIEEVVYSACSKANLNHNILQV